MEPRVWKSISPRERVRKRSFPDVTLTAHDGARLRLYEDMIRDRIVVLSFLYARCRGVCVPVTANLRRVQDLMSKRVGKDVFFWSFTLKPEEDTPEELAALARRHDLGPGWRFLTGKPEDLERVRRSLGFVDPDPVRDADKSNHLGMVVFGNEPLVLWGGCPGMTSPESMVTSILNVDWPENRKPAFTALPLPESATAEHR